MDHEQNGQEQITPAEAENEIMNNASTIMPPPPLHSQKYAGFWMRFWAYTLDLIVIGSINRIIINPIFRATGLDLHDTGLFSMATIATAVVFYAYFVVMTKYFGQTLGKMVFGLRVVPLRGETLSWSTVLFREWIGRFISSFIILLYILVAFLPKKQGLHDVFADTTVVHEA